MMPYNSYRLYQIERAKRPDEIRYADGQAARIASATSSLSCGITRLVRAMCRPSPAATRACPARPDPFVCAAKGPMRAPGPSLCPAWRRA